MSNVYVGCAPSDAGQSLGNAIFLLNQVAPQFIKFIKLPYLGIRYNDVDIFDAFKKYKNDLIKINELSRHIAKELSDGKIIAIFNNESEFGHRALGNRSIIASPELKHSSVILYKLLNSEKVRKCHG